MVFSCRWGAPHRKIDELSICSQILFQIYFACWLYLVPVSILPKNSFKPSTDLKEASLQRRTISVHLLARPKDKHTSCYFYKALCPSNALFRLILHVFSLTEHSKDQINIFNFSTVNYLAIYIEKFKQYLFFCMYRNLRIPVYFF